LTKFDNKKAQKRKNRIEMTKIGDKSLILLQIMSAIPNGIINYKNLYALPPIQKGGLLSIVLLG